MKKRTKLNKKTLLVRFDFIEQRHIELNECKILIKNRTGRHYPIMKITDMYFWKLGYDKELEEKTIELKLKRHYHKN